VDRLIPLVCFATTRIHGGDVELRVWRAVALAFLVCRWDVPRCRRFRYGLKLPEILLRFVPFVANARMPGRAMVGVYLALAMILAMQASASTGRFSIRRACSGLQSHSSRSNTGLPFDDDASIVRRCTRPLASAEPGAVCELPLGVGDGLSTGVGSQDRRVLFYATQHELRSSPATSAAWPSDAAYRYHAPQSSARCSLSDGAPFGVAQRRRRLSPALHSWSIAPRHPQLWRPTSNSGGPGSFLPTRNTTSNEFASIRPAGAGVLIARLDRMTMDMKAEVRECGS